MILRTQPTLHTPRVASTNHVLLAVLLCALVGTFAARAHGDDQASLIDKALNQSGLAAQVESLPTAVLVAVPADVFPDAKTKDAVIAALKKSAAKETLIAPLQEALRTDYHEEMIEKVIAFYDSKTGRKVARIESKGLASDLLKSIREGRKTAVSMDEKRLNLLRRLIRADKVGETNSVLVTMLVKGLFHGSSMEGNGGKPPAPVDVQQLPGDNKTEDSRIEEFALVGFALTFRSLDDKELEELAQFQESDAGVWFQKRVIKGLQETVSRVGAALGEALHKARNS